MTDPAAFVGLLPADPGSFVVTDGVDAQDLRVDLGVVNGHFTPETAATILETVRAASADGLLTATVVGAGVLGDDVVLHLSSPEIVAMTEDLVDYVDGVLTATLTVGTPSKPEHWESMIVQAIAKVGSTVQFRAVSLDLGSDAIDVALTDNSAPLFQGDPVMWFDGTSREGVVIECHGDLPTGVVVVDTGDGAFTEVELGMVARTGAFRFREDQPRDYHGRWTKVLTGAEAAAKAGEWESEHGPWDPQSGYMDWTPRAGEPLGYRGTPKNPLPGSLTEEQLARAHAATDALLDHAAEAEPEVTAAVKRVAAATGGVVIGLEFAKKGKPRTLQKITEKIVKGHSPEEAAGAINDALRYTIQYPADDYAHASNAAMAAAIEGGYQVAILKNYWQDPDKHRQVEYQGVNAVLLAPTGVRIEVQSHTAESFDTKEHGTHALYEQTRSMPEGSDEWWDLYTQQEVMFHAIPFPPQADQIGVGQGYPAHNVPPEHAIPDRYLRRYGLTVDVDPTVGQFRFNRDQPRVPAGSPKGGEWAKAGGADGGVVSGKHPESIVSRIVDRLNRADATPVTDGPSPVLHRKLVMPDRRSRQQVGPEGKIPRPGRRGKAIRTTTEDLRVGDTLYSDENTPAGKITKIDDRWVHQGGHVEVHTDRSKIPWGYRPGEEVYVHPDRGPERKTHTRLGDPYDSGLPRGRSRWPGQSEPQEDAPVIVEERPTRRRVERQPRRSNQSSRPPFRIGRDPGRSFTIDPADIGQFADGAVVEKVDGVMRWRGPLVPEGVPSGDGRSIAPGALTWRELPLTLMCMFRNADGGEGHAAAVAVGRIDKLWRPEDKPTVIWGEGVYANTPEGIQAFEMARDKFLRGVSVDLCNLQVDSVAGRGAKGRLNITSGEIMGATQCAFPAFAEAWLEILSDETLVASGGTRIEARFHSLYDGVQTLVASAGGSSLYPVRPPREWFEQTQFLNYQPVRVTEAGQVFGHVADWKGCHIGWGDRCVPPPRSHSNYAEFRKGEVLCSDGSFVQTGPVVTNTVHPDLAMMASDAQAFYHDTGCVVADVVVYEDRFGIAIAGAVRPDADEIQVRALRGGDFSPDWRPMLSGPSRGFVEMCALLTVNNSGFKVPLSLVAAAGGNVIIPGSGTYARVDVTTGEVLAMVASSGPNRSNVHVEQITRLNHEIEALTTQIHRLRADKALAKIGT